MTSKVNSFHVICRLNFIREGGKRKVKGGKGRKGKKGEGKGKEIGKGIGKKTREREWERG